MITLDSLRAYGANVDEGLARCMNMESFYLRIVNMLVNDDDKSVQRLRDGLAAGDTAAVFEAAHALKGSTGNVSITPMFEPICALSDTLKGHTDAPLSPEHIRLAEEALEQYEKLKAL